MAVTRFALLAPLSVLAAGALMGNSPAEGVYDASHKVDATTGSGLNTNYLVIDQFGAITAYTFQNSNDAEPDRGCYKLAQGTETNAVLQSRSFYRSVSPKGEPALVAWIGQLTFGLVLGPNDGRPTRWFVRNSETKSVVDVTGSHNWVSIGEGPVAITLPRLPWRMKQEITQNLCSPATD